MFRPFSWVILRRTRTLALVPELRHRCAARILHNSLQTNAGILPIDVEATVNKICQYFHTCTVRVEELKAFYDFVDVEYCDGFARCIAGRVLAHAPRNSACAGDVRQQ
jgi:hypothetical protein